LLYRIAETQPKDLFVLNGGALFYCWTEKLDRPTRDIDLLGTGEPSPERFKVIFTEVISAEYEDRFVFDKDSQVVDRVKDDQQYGVEFNSHSVCHKICRHFGISCAFEIS
jgi:hypothetical protein